MMSRGAKPAVLLLSPGIIKWTDADFGLPHLVSLGGYLEAHAGVRAEIVDLGYEGGDLAHLSRTLDELGPFVMVGISCYASYDLMRVLTLAKFLKRKWPDVPFVAGGYHVSALPGDLDFPGSPFDAVVVGEGELPMLRLVQKVLGGGRIQELGSRLGPENITELDTLPPYRWDLLRRYWPRATAIGRKLQIVLSRGCPYRCTFCMERAKTEYAWRAYSPERAIDELRRLKSFTDLSQFVVNIADPLFGFKRRWRREVLEGILTHEVVPRQFWTLTRSDDLDEVDVSLLARARFSIGIGLESGSPRMLEIMQKGNTPERYLGAIERLARLSRDHGLNWATNIIVGHPGETPETLIETRDFLKRLFLTAGDTCGWLSIDPFRLYPGAIVHEQMTAWSATHGTRFHHPEWWKSWYDGGFRAQHLDPSTTLDYETRVRFMHDEYAPIVKQIAARFRGTGRSVDRVFERSLAEQVRQLEPEARDGLIRRGKRALDDASTGPKAERAMPTIPIGLMVRDPAVRRREEAVRRLLESGVLRTESLIEALLTVAPEPFLGEADATAMFSEKTPTPGAEGEVPSYLPFTWIALALEALGPLTGDRVADTTARSGYVAALLATLVGQAGRVIAVSPGSL
ncbi:MAG: radical SAM protein, partial [Myxococcales bacterium]|nr:radical SAM protein [Myxococcales bacterium]